MAQEAKIAAMLELIDDLVNEETKTPWKEKAKHIKSTAKASGHETALLEFISWYDEYDDF